MHFLLYFWPSSVSGSPRMDARSRKIRKLKIPILQFKFPATAELKNPSESPPFCLYPLFHRNGPPCNRVGSERPKQIFYRNTEIYFGKNWIFGVSALPKHRNRIISVFWSCRNSAETTKMAEITEIPKPKHYSVVHCVLHHEGEKPCDWKRQRHLMTTKWQSARQPRQVFRIVRSRCYPEPPMFRLG